MAETLEKKKRGRPPKGLQKVGFSIRPDQAAALRVIAQARAGMTGAWDASAVLREMLDASPLRKAAGEALEQWSFPIEELRKELATDRGDFATMQRLAGGTRELAKKVRNGWPPAAEGRSTRRKK